MISVRNAALAATIALVSPAVAHAQTASQGSAGCTAITQAAINGAQARIAADDAAIGAPKSVTTLSCLDNFFNGAGLNVITNLLDPTQLLKSVEGQICSAVQSTWNSLLGSAQCGLTLTGFNLGFLGGLGTGSFCPKLSFGGGGPPIGGISVGGQGNGRLYVNGAGTTPAGYTLPATGGLW